MKTSTKITIGIIAAIAIGGGIFILNKRRKEEKVEGIVDAESNTGGIKPSKPTTTKSTDDITKNAIDSETKSGKTIFAVRDGVKVWSDNLMKSLYKEASKNEWIGKVASVTKIGNTPVYKTEHGKYVVVAGTYLSK